MFSNQMKLSDSINSLSVRAAPGSVTWAQLPGELSQTPSLGHYTTFIWKYIFTNSPLSGSEFNLKCKCAIFQLDSKIFSYDKQ